MRLLLKPLQRTSRNKWMNFVRVTSNHNPRIILPEDGCTCHALKAERTPPVWYRDAAQLWSLVSGAWDKVSKDFVEQLLKAFRDGDTDKIEKLIKQLKDLGVDMTKALGQMPDAVFDN